MAVQNADLVDAPVDHERQAQHDEPWNQKNQTGTDQTPARQLVQNVVKELEGVKRGAEDDVGQGHASNGSSHVELPSPDRVGR